MRAFNVETAQVLGSTKEPQIAQMRLQWWRDAVGDICAGKPPEHPVALALSAVVAGSPVKSKRWLERVVDARIKDAAMDRAPPSVAHLEEYANGKAVQARP